MGSDFHHVQPLVYQKVPYIQGVPAPAPGFCSTNPSSWHTFIHQQLLLEAWEMSKKYGKSPNKKKVHSLKPTNHPKNRPVAPKEERIVSQPPWLSGAKRLVMWTYKSVIEDHLFLTPHVICTRVKTPHLS